MKKDVLEMSNDEFAMYAYQLGTRLGKLTAKNNKEYKAMHLWPRRLLGAFYGQITRYNNLNNQRKLYNGNF